MPEQETTDQFYKGRMISVRLELAEGTDRKEFLGMLLKKLNYEHEVIKGAKIVSVYFAGCDPDALLEDAKKEMIEHINNLPSLL